MKVMRSCPEELEVEMCGGLYKFKQEWREAVVEYLKEYEGLDEPMQAQELKIFVVHLIIYLEACLKARPAPDFSLILKRRKKK